MSEAPAARAGGRAGRLLAAVDALAPLVEAERARLDRDRLLPTRLLDALVAAGLFRLWAPRRLGGAELDPVAGLRVIAAVSALDGSVGWNVMVASAHSFLAGRLPDRAARDIFGSRRSIVAGQLEPGGTAAPVKGGYRVSGRWPFASGCRHATWLLAHCRLPSRGRRRAAEPAGSRLVFVPAERARIHDTWQTAGLRGTGSHDYSLEGVHVPASHAVDAFADEPTRSEPLYACPLVAFVTMAVGAVPIGIARGAIGDFLRLARTRRRAGRLLAESVSVQRGLARALVHARSGERLLLEAVDDLWRTVRTRKPATIEQRAAVRMGCVNAGVAAAAAVDLLWELAGAGAVFEAAGLERRFRDVHVATQHVALAPRTLEVAGRVALGLDPRGIF